MQIQISGDGFTFTVSLGDGTAARDLATKLPMTVEVSDFLEVSKVAHVPENLHVYGEPESMKPVAGDIAYYSRWGNLAMYYRDGEEEEIGLIRLGTIDGDASVLESIPEDSQATITAVE